jgi:hypothetical protein
MALVVISPFSTYAIGQSITDNTQIAAALEYYPEKVVQVGTPISPLPVALYSSGNIYGTIGPFHRNPLGVSVVIYVDGSTTPFGTVTADINGNWTISSSGLSAGSHTVNVKIDLSSSAISTIAPTLGTLTLSASTVASGSSQGTVIGNLVGTTTGSTVAITAQSNAGALQIVSTGGGWQIQVGASLPSGVNSLTFSVQETLSGAIGNPNTTAGIAVSETVTLQTLTLSANAFIVAASPGTVIGTVLGTSAGSTLAISAQSNAGALALTGPVSNVWTLTVGASAPGSPTSLTLSLQETLAGAIGSPKTTAGIAVSEVASGGNAMFNNASYSALIAAVAA